VNLREQTPTNEAVQPKPRADVEAERLEDARRRQAGASFDERMEQLTRDAPKPPRPDQDRRRRR
jgi:hypothetical protein